LNDWLEKFHSKYQFIGKMIGIYYSQDGRKTNLLIDTEKKMKLGLEERKLEEERESAGTQNNNNKKSLKLVNINKNTYDNNSNNNNNSSNNDNNNNNKQIRKGGGEYSVSNDSKTNSLVEDRVKHLGPTYTHFYRKPLHLVKGFSFILFILIQNCFVITFLSLFF
jgi:hypothetical protein